jgi:hypothetical protein
MSVGGYCRQQALESSNESCDPCVEFTHKVVTAKTSQRVVYRRLGCHFSAALLAAAH